MSTTKLFKRGAKKAFRAFETNLAPDFGSQGALALEAKFEVLFVAACARDHGAVRVEGVQRQHRPLLEGVGLSVLQQRGNTLKGLR